jgi:hypothetical protein
MNKESEEKNMERVNLEDLSKEELQDLLAKYSDYVMNYEEEHELGGSPVCIYEYYDNEYQLEKEIPTLKGVGVNGTENGIAITLKGLDNETLARYSVNVNMENLDEDTLYNVCYNISQTIYNLYYEKNGTLEQEDILSVVRNELVK